MKRVIIFSTFYDPYMSGAERMVKEVVERLQDRYSFIIVTARLDRRLTTNDKRHNIEIQRIGFGFRSDKYLYPLLAPFYALKYRSKIVHAVMESYAGIALLVFSYIAKLYIRYSIFNILTLQSGDLDLSEKQARIPQWLWRCIHSKPDLVVSIGNSMADRARKFGAKNVRVIPNGVDLVAAERVVAKNLQKQPHRIVCVARLSPEKGLEYLIDAMPEVLKEFPDAQLVLVGEGSDRKNIEYRISNIEHHAKNAVTLLGSLSHEKTLEEIAKSGIFVLPSLAEGMGIVLVEAQALGVPVVGTNVGGIPDVIEHGKTGLLVSSKDSSAIAQAVIRILRDHELRERMVREAKTRLAKFDWAGISEQYDKIYKRFLATKVLIATGIYPPDIGGPAMYSFYLNNGLRKNGFQTKVVAYGSSGSDSSYITVFGESLTPDFVDRNQSVLKRYFTYFKKIKAFGRNFDVIYVQDSVSAGLPVMIATWFLRKPYVLKIVGDYAWEQGQNKYGIRDTLDEFLGKKYDRKIELMRWIEKLVAKRAKLIIVPSNYLKAVVRKWGISGDQIEVIYNSFDWKSVVLPKVSAEIPDHDVIYSVGRLVPWKGFDTLIEVMGDLVKEKPSLELIIYGDGPERGRLGLKIKNLGLQDSVKLLGRIEHEKLLEKLQGERKFFVLNSSYEGMSHQILESQAVKVPCAVSRVGGNPEIVEDGKTGLLFEYNNKEQIKSAILKLLNNGELVKDIQECAYQQILERHDFNKMIEKTITTLKSIL